MSKRSYQLFEFLVEISRNLEEAAAVFSTGLEDLSNTEKLATQMSEIENRGDALTAELIQLLDATYITPLDREDYLSLANHLDDIVDGLQAATVRFELYNITQATSVMVEFAKTITASINEVFQAMSKLQNRRLADVRVHTTALNHLEKAGDKLLLESLRVLFSDEQDTLTIIKLKEVYEILERVTDRCDDVGQVLDSVVLKNA